MYTYTGYDIHGAIPLLFSSPLADSPCSLFYSPLLTWKPSLLWQDLSTSFPGCSWTDLPISLPLLIYPSFQVNRCSLWAPQVKGPNPCSSGYIFPHTSPFCIVHKAQLYILMDRMEPLMLGLPKSRTIIPSCCVEMKMVTMRHFTFSFSV